MRGSLIKDCKTPTSRNTSSPYHSLRSAPLLFFGNFLKKEVLKMKRRKPAIDGARTTTGAVVSSTLDAEPLPSLLSPRLRSTWRNHCSQGHSRSPHGWFTPFHF